MINLQNLIYFLFNIFLKNLLNPIVLNLFQSIRIEFKIN